MNYPPLPKSYKKKYPFRLGTTSYIYPDHILPNVKKLAPYVDEIEILLYESRETDNFPTEREIEKLRRLSTKFDLTYNVHLPIDISVSDPDPCRRNHAIKAIKRVIDLTFPLCPTTFTLHLPYGEITSERETVEKWRDLSYESMDRLLAMGVESRRISVETLMYPFEWVDKIIRDLDLAVCIDLGHLILCEIEIETVFNAYADRTSIIHLHGVENKRDHVSLDKIDPSKINPILRILKQFEGVVSLEVFSYGHLTASLEWLEHIFV
jgi:sugar phosphate isomerase/epimerase